MRGKGKGRERRGEREGLVEIGKSKEIEREKG